MSKKNFAKLSDTVDRDSLPTDLPDPLGARGSVFDGKLEHQEFLRTRARQMRMILVCKGLLMPNGPEVEDFIKDGMSFSMHDRHVGGLGVYARPLPSEVK